MKEEIIESFDKAIESLKKDMIMMELLKRIKLDLADSSLDFFVNTLIEMKKEKKEYEKELKDEFKGDEKKYLESIKSESLNYLKMKSALEELAKEKGIEISEAEIFDSAKQRYEGAKISDERIKVLIDKNQGIKDEIKEDLLQSKVAEELLKNAKITFEDLKSDDSKALEESEETK
jgi:FKBP-type peptidyl-prolyl cis-trans isomerase (trigger factor)